MQGINTRTVPRDTIDEDALSSGVLDTLRIHVISQPSRTEPGAKRRSVGTAARSPALFRGTKAFLQARYRHDYNKQIQFSRLC